ncbi:hypothetical protein [Pseudofrankia asymbiotica]|uniref:hypothetical protein n=1 Tax=Pseudofrankia asymbiotica TaxID=1834516 RepID=UPI00105646C5|nr:hypothetical protein [Pseudofrankia asymbiotica]
MGTTEYSRGTFTLETNSNYSSVNLDKVPIAVINDGGAFEIWAPDRDSARGTYITAYNGHVSPWVGPDAPTSNQCLTQAMSNPASKIVIVPGMLICVITSEGRTGYITVQTVAVGSAVFQAVIWEKPS